MKLGTVLAHRPGEDGAARTSAIVRCVIACVLLASGLGFAAAPANAQPSCVFESTWDTTKGTDAANQIVMPLHGGGYTVDWGDGSPVSGPHTSPATHNYSPEGQYTITVTAVGATPEWDPAHGLGHSTLYQSPYFVTKSNEDLVNVSSWCGVRIGNSGYQFAKTTSLRSLATPDLTAVTNLSFGFQLSKFNGSLNDWDVSNVERMEGLFAAASTFNQPLNAWDVSSVTTMNSMFSGASDFNQPLSTWDVSSVTTMNSMFASASDFNQPLNAWDVSAVTKMNAMFSSASTFNQPLDNWEVANATSLSGMFAFASSFDQPLNSWNVANVTDLSSMFGYAEAFDQPLAGWDVSGVVNMSGMFSGAANFDQPLNSWNVASVTDARWMFEDAASFDQPLSNWATSELRRARSMFRNATSFNQDLGAWDVSAIENASDMLSGAGLSEANYTSLLAGWARPELTLTSGVEFSADSTAYYASAASARQRLTDTFSWNITDGGEVPDPAPPSPPAPPACAHVSTWDTRLGWDQTPELLLPITGGSFTVDWGDATVNTYPADGPVSHVYGTGGSYTITVTGTGGSPVWDPPSVTGYFGLDSRRDLVEVLSWCGVGLGNSGSQFAGTEALVDVGQPDFTGVSNLESAFADSTFNGSLADWDVSQITNMKSMFAGASAFNQPLASWDVSAVTDMSFMFSNARSFDRPIGDWNVSGVTTMESMFASAEAFNQPLEAWNLSSLSSTEGMFYDARAFNQPLNAWDVSGVAEMRSMFNSAVSFNQPLGNWDVSNLIATDEMFAGADSFNQPLADWDVSNVTSMQSMFNSADAFNQPLESWNVANVTNMINLFAEASAFNQPLSNWNTASVTDMRSMFGRATAFNQPLGSWTVSNVTNMDAMFNDATSFNQPLAGWDVANVTRMGSMFDGASAFNQPLESWDVGQVDSMGGMFRDAVSFNQPLADWDVANVVRMVSMFRNATAFNQPLESWDVGQVDSMGGMFRGAVSFNQPLGSWDVSRVSDAFAMFSDASAFDQDLGAWDVSALRDASGMFDGSGLSTENYTNLLIGWGRAEITVHDGVWFSAVPTSYYTSAIPARERLTETFGWEITDGGVTDRPPHNPSFDAPVPTTDGFTVVITNYDAAFSYSPIASAGAVEIDGVGLVTVSGLAPGTQSTITVNTTRAGYAPGTAEVVGTSSMPSGGACPSELVLGSVVLHLGDVDWTPACLDGDATFTGGSATVGGVAFADLSGSISAGSVHITGGEVHTPDGWGNSDVSGIAPHLGQVKSWNLHASRAHGLWNAMAGTVTLENVALLPLPPGWTMGDVTVSFGADVDLLTGVPVSTLVVTTTVTQDPDQGPGTMDVAGTVRDGVADVDVAGYSLVRLGRSGSEVSLDGTANVEGIGSGSVAFVLTVSTTDEIPLITNGANGAPKLALAGAAATWDGSTIAVQTTAKLTYKQGADPIIFALNGSYTDVDHWSATASNSQTWNIQNVLEINSISGTLTRDGDFHWYELIAQTTPLGWDLGDVLSVDSIDAKLTNVCDACTDDTALLTELAVSGHLDQQEVVNLIMKGVPGYAPADFDASTLADVPISLTMLLDLQTLDYELTGELVLGNYDLGPLSLNAVTLGLGKYDLPYGLCQVSPAEADDGTGPTPGTDHEPELGPSTGNLKTVGDPQLAFSSDVIIDNLSIGAIPVFGRITNQGPCLATFGSRLGSLLPSEASISNLFLMYSAYPTAVDMPAGKSYEIGARGIGIGGVFTIPSWIQQPLGNQFHPKADIFGTLTTFPTLPPKLQASIDLDLSNDRVIQLGTSSLRVYKDLDPLTFTYQSGRTFRIGGGANSRLYVDVNVNNLQALDVSTHTTLSIEKTASTTSIVFGAELTKQQQNLFGIKGFNVDHLGIKIKSVNGVYSGAVWGSGAAPDELVSHLGIQNGSKIYFGLEMGVGSSFCGMFQLQKAGGAQVALNLANTGLVTSKFVRIGLAPTGGCVFGLGDGRQALPAADSMFRIPAGMSLKFDATVGDKWTIAVDATLTRYTDHRYSFSATVDAADIDLGIAAAEKIKLRIDKSKADDASVAIKGALEIGDDSARFWGELKKDGREVNAAIKARAVKLSLPGAGSNFAKLLNVKLEGEFALDASDNSESFTFTAKLPFPGSSYSTTTENRGDWDEYSWASLDGGKFLKVTEASIKIKDGQITKCAGFVEASVKILGQSVDAFVGWDWESGEKFKVSVGVAFKVFGYTFRMLDANVKLDSIMEDGGFNLSNLEWKWYGLRVDLVFVKGHAELQPRMDVKIAPDGTDDLKAVVNVKLAGRSQGCIWIFKWHCAPKSGEAKFDSGWKKIEAKTEIEAKIETGSWKTDNYTKAYVSINLGKAEAKAGVQGAKRNIEGKKVTEKSELKFGVSTLVNLAGWSKAAGEAGAKEFASARKAVK